MRILYCYYTKLSCLLIILGYFSPETTLLLSFKDSHGNSSTISTGVFPKNPQSSIPRFLKKFIWRFFKHPSRSYYVICFPIISSNLSRDYPGELSRNFSGSTDYQLMIPGIPPGFFTEFVQRFLMKGRFH